MHPDRPCMNCGDPTPGEYCPSCGQRKVDIQVSVRALFMEVLEDQFILDRRLPRTLGALLFKPGHLTVEHVNGRIVRYIHPFRLYLVSSLIFFVLLSFFSLRLVRTAMLDGDGPNVAIQIDGEVGQLEPADESPADSPALRVAQLDSALATLDRTVADTAIPALVRQALAANRSGILRQRQAAASQLAARGTGGDTTAVVPPADTVAATPDGAEADADRTLAETFGWDETPPTIEFGHPRVDSVMVGQVRRLGSMTPREAAETLTGTFLSYVPTMMFLLLPVFAGVLKLLYIRRRRYYAEHFVFLLHIHSMVFLLATALLVLRGYLAALVEVLLMGWIVVYILLAMKRVYGQGWLKTFAKYWTLGWMYFWILLVSILVAFIAALALF